MEGKVILFKNLFKSRIGIVYYLWRDAGKRTKIIFLSLNKNSRRVFLDRVVSSRNAGSIEIKEKRSPEIEDQVGNYLEGRSNRMDLEPEFISGSGFEKKVWLAAFSVPFGETASYSEIAMLSGHEGAHRATGTALGKNPVMIIVPCHRIIKINGDIGGFSGGKGIKETLLKLEDNEVIGKKVL